MPANRTIRLLDRAAAAFLPSRVGAAPPACRSRYSPGVIRCSRRNSRARSQPPRPAGSMVRLDDLRNPAAIRWNAECLALLAPETLTPVIAGRWLEGYDAGRLASMIRCPVRLLQADPAAGGPLSDADRDAFAAAATDCTVETFPGTGHLIQWAEPSRDADAVDAIMTARSCKPTAGLAPRE